MQPSHNDMLRYLLAQIALHWRALSLERCNFMPQDRELDRRMVSIHVGYHSELTGMTVVTIRASQETMLRAIMRDDSTAKRMIKNVVVEAERKLAIRVGLGGA